MKTRSFCTALALTVVCGSALADWQLRQYGQTPAGELRGSYPTQDACRKAMAELGKKSPGADYNCVERK